MTAAEWTPECVVEFPDAGIDNISVAKILSLLRNVVFVKNIYAK